MKQVVVDASVAIKWLLPQGQEDHMERAMALLHAFRDDELALVQPPHWLAEVGAVLVRLEPEIATTAIQLLDAMNLPTRNDTEIYAKGIELAAQLDHHLFDTLYHAVALTLADATLVTADLRYFRKARHLGGICALGDFTHT